MGINDVLPLKEEGQEDDCDLVSYVAWYLVTLGSNLAIYGAEKIYNLTEPTIQLQNILS
jgi:hypothetical protein